MIENSHLNHFIESQIKFEYLSVPSKAILLEEGKVAEKLYLIRKGCFSIMKGKVLLPSSFLRGILSPHSMVYINARRVFSIWKGWNSISAFPSDTSNNVQAYLACAFLD